MTDRDFGFITVEGLVVSCLSDETAYKLAEEHVKRTGTPVVVTGPIETLEPENE